MSNSYEAAREEFLAGSENGQPAEPAGKQGRKRCDWQPDRDDHFIYNQVKFEGMTQRWVAGLLEISQSTVSRVVKRYERWLAHAEKRAGGQLDHAERRRSQRWLTYERNELILATCLRIASDMERDRDVTRLVMSRSRSSDEELTRREMSSEDRSGVAARFLRLAFRINMEQLKLVESDEPPPAPPLSAEQVALEEEAAAQARAELAAVRARSEACSQREAAEQQQAELVAKLQEEAERSELARQLAAELAQPSPAAAAADAAAAAAAVHQLHHDSAAASAASAGAAIPCGENGRAEKNGADARITSNRRPRRAANPQRDDDRQGRAARKELVTASPQPMQSSAQRLPR